MRNFKINVLFFICMLVLIPTIKADELKCNFSGKPFVGSKQGTLYAQWQIETSGIFYIVERNVLGERHDYGIDTHWAFNGLDSEIDIYFCLEKGVSISDANNIVAVCTSECHETNKVKEDRYQVAIGRIISEFINTGSCSKDEYAAAQIAIHETLIPNSYTQDIKNTFSGWSDYFELGKADQTYWGYDETNLRVYNDSEKKYVITESDLELKSGKYEQNFYVNNNNFSENINWKILKNGIEYKSGTTNSNEELKISLSASDIAVTDQLQLVITSTRTFYKITDHIIPVKNGENRQDLAKAKVTTKLKTLTKTIPLLINNTSRKLFISKVVSGTNMTITSSKVKVGVYGNSTCTGTPIETKTFRGAISFSLNPGVYSVKELEAPTGYELNNSCYSVNLNENLNELVSIENSSQCISEVAKLIDQGNLTRDKRINLYEQLLDLGLNYNNLLNFNLYFDYDVGGNMEELATEICSNKKCSSIAGDCLYATNNSDFSLNDWSCYNEKINVGGYRGYCYVTYNFRKNNNLDFSSSTKKVKSGQFVFRVSQGQTIGNSILAKKCFFPDYPGTDRIEQGDYSDYISFVKFGDVLNSNNTSQKLILKKQGTGILMGDVSGDGIVDETDYDMIMEYDTGIIELDDVALSKADANNDGEVTSLDAAYVAKYLMNKSDNAIEYFGKTEVKYAASDIYVKKISGMICTSDELSDLNISKTCKYIGTGLISAFKGYYDSINTHLLSGNVLLPFEVNFADKSIFGVNKVAGDCLYSLEEEIITYDDKGNAELELEFRTIDTNNPFNRDTNANWCYNGDCSYNNERVQKYILDRTVNNSYNRTGNGPIYRIELTPTLIKEIREYNAEEGRTYDNYELDCDKKGNCSNAFLKNFNIVKK